MNGDTTIETGLDAAPKRGAVWLGVALGTMTCLAFLPALEAAFVFDDEVAIVRNELLRNSQGLWQIWFEPSANQDEGHYWPLVYTSLWLDYQIWGLRPFGYHLHNLLLHVANVVLLWRLCLRLRVPGAWWAAALFALHPVHVESVVWAIERKDVLSTLFYLLALGSYVRWQGRTGARFCVFALIFYIAGLLSKSMVVSLPVAIMILHWWKGGTLEDVGRRGEAPSFVSGSLAARLGLTRAHVLALLSFFVVGLAMVAFDFWLMHEKATGAYPWTPVERCLIAGRALTFYLGTLAWPMDLLLIYPRWDVDAGDVRAWLHPLAVLVTLALLWLTRRRIGRGPAAALLFFLVTVAPVLGFIDFSYMGHAFVADRYLYLASAGPLALGAAVAVGGFHRLVPVGRVLASAGGVVVLIVLGMVTWRQSELYRDPKVLFEDTLAGNPSSSLARFHMGWALYKTHAFEAAAHHFEEGLRRQGDHSFAREKLIQSLLQAGQQRDGGGRRREAMGYYLRVLKYDPREPRAAHNLAWILATHADPAVRDGDEAVRLAGIALEHFGETRPEFLGTAAAAYAEAGRFAEAIEVAERAVTLAEAQKKRAFVRATEARLTGFRQRRPVRVTPSDALTSP